MISPSINAAMSGFANSPKNGNIAEMVTGALASPVGGRTDHLPVSTPDGAFVIPADVVSALGSGNTLAGFEVLKKMFPPPPAGLAGQGKSLDVAVAGGEFIVPPQSVAEVGGGDVQHGHDVLDAFVKQTRSKYNAHLSSLPGPKSSK